MRPLKILTWQTHGSYLYYLTQAPHDFFVLSKPDRPPGFGGRSGQMAWGDNVHDMPLTKARHHQFDCVLFQDDEQFEKEQYEFLTAAQRALPRIYIEHAPPRAHPPHTRHLIGDPNVMLVHVSHFKALMWDNGRTPHRVIEHGVLIADHVQYRGDLDKGLVVINHMARRGRRLGADIFCEARKRVELDLVGMGEIPHALLPAFAARYRYLFNPIRYTSLTLAVIEAMMVGLPVVALATTEMVTVIDNASSGFIDTDPHVLHGYMRELARYPILAWDLGATARLRARTLRHRTLLHRLEHAAARGDRHQHTGATCYGVNCRSGKKTNNICVNASGSSTFPQARPIMRPMSRCSLSWKRLPASSFAAALATKACAAPFSSIRGVPLPSKRPSCTNGRSCTCRCRRRHRASGRNSPGLITDGKDV